MKHFLPVFFCALLAHGVSAAAPLDIGSGRQLFLDDFIIERIDGLKRVMHQPVKRGAVIQPDQPWETSLQTRCSPAWDAKRKRFKLWLITSTNIPGLAGTSYAESKDGVHWPKPVLRQTKISGSLENNLLAVVPGDTWPGNGIENVVIDPDDPDPKRRYKGFYGVSGRRPMVSPDGIHWTLLETSVLRRDGFVSMRAGDKVGQLITKPFTATGDQLLLNVDVHPDGETCVEVLREDGKPFPGFALSDSVPLHGTGVDQSVTWHDTYWFRLAEKRVALRITLRNADLYSFHVRKDDP